MASTQTTNTSPVSGATGQLSSRQTSSINVGTTERWVSVIGGSVLTLLAAVYDIRGRRISPLGVIMTVLGGDLIYRGTTGHCYIYQALGINTAGQSDTVPQKFEKVMIIKRPTEDLRRFQQGTDTLESLASTQSASSAKPTSTQQVNADAEQGQLQAWQMLKETASKYSGYIQFEKAPDGRGTEVKVMIEYSQPPAGKLGAGIFMLTGKSPQQQITEDLRHFKEMMEAGEVPSVEGQPTGRK